jgi:hypothetical protein
MKFPVIQRLLGLSAIFLFVADIPPPPPKKDQPDKPSSSGCHKASEALYKARPAFYGSAVK